MRSLPSVAVVLAAAAAVTWVAPAYAQVTDAERAAARTLFQAGDELQRAGKFAEALDKFQRAQQVFSAPTNMLRIAECDAALGRLVESAEAYRAVVRTPLPPGSPSAFQAAVDQARGELAQVEPRVPKLVVQVDPPNVPNPQLQIDGQTVPAAILGEPFPLDPGTHRVLVSAAGFAGAEQSVVLREHDSKSVQITLRAIPGVTYAPAGQAPAPPPPAPPYTAGELPPGTPPPPPPLPVGQREPEVYRKPSTWGVLAGLHLGLELPAGDVQGPDGSSVDVSSASGGGLAYGLDGGLRFARHWYGGLTLEHAGLGGRADGSSFLAGASATSSNTTTVGLALGFIVNPDRPSFFGQIGVQERWYDVSYTDPAGRHTASYAAAELLLGVGVWVPVGTSVRLVPEATVGLGSFGAPSLTGSPSTETTGDSPGHEFVMLGLAGFYNIDF